MTDWRDHDRAWAEYDEVAMQYRRVYPVLSEWERWKCRVDLYMIRTANRFLEWLDRVTSQ